MLNNNEKFIKILIQDKKKITLDIEDIFKISMQLFIERNNMLSVFFKFFYQFQSYIIRSKYNRFYLLEFTDKLFRSSNNILNTDLIKDIVINKNKECLSVLRYIAFYFINMLSIITFNYIVVFIKSIISFQFLPYVIIFRKDKISNFLNSKWLNSKQELNQLRFRSTNFALLGESVLGCKDAEQRLNSYLTMIKSYPEQDIGIKLSALSPPINLIAYDYHVEDLKEKLRVLFRASLNHDKHCIHLDMESFDEVHLTIDVFKQVLSERDFLSYTASIALQSYLPDSYYILEDLISFSKLRVNSGGAPIRIRLIKGANLALERVNASLTGHSLPVFSLKEATDTQFKRMLFLLFKEDNLAYIKLGVGSHNIFDISFLIHLYVKSKYKTSIELEMLHGLGYPINAIIKERYSINVLMYTPLSHPNHFDHSVAYLVRRLNESTSKDHFLRDCFDYNCKSSNYTKQKSFFLNSFKCIDQLPPKSFRTQLRDSMTYSTYKLKNDFSNVVDTDWSIKENRDWIFNIFNKNMTIDIVLNTENEGQFIERFSPNSLDKPLYKTQLLSPDKVNTIFEKADLGFKSWSDLAIYRRAEIMAEVARVFEANRGVLIHSIVLDVGKPITEADAEVSEAIDFLKYYAKCAYDMSQNSELSFIAKGISLVTMPWNFSCAISVGCIASSLVTGNVVLFKPAPEAELVGRVVTDLFFKGGCPKNILYYIPCVESGLGKTLISSSKISTIQLVGATKTAELFRKTNPYSSLIAETGGKNTIIVTESADRDEAVKGIVNSAFGYSGQKCSAASVVILVGDLFNDALFKEKLKDATESLLVGDSNDPKTDITPLITPHNTPYLHAIQNLEKHESWLVKSKQLRVNLFSPGIKWNVKPGGFLHQTECFGPVLGVMHAKNLKDAVSIANSTEYGLTAGLFTLNSQDISYFKTHIQAGNMYINREITGAIVKRQPFGGIKKSSFGLGFKAGGPHYLHQLWQVREKQQDNDMYNNDACNINNEFLKFEELKINEFAGLTHNQRNTLTKSLNNYKDTWMLFQIEKDHSNCLGQRNYTIYRSHINLNFRFKKGDKLSDIYRVLAVIALLKLKNPVVSLSSTIKQQDLHAVSTYMKTMNIKYLVEDEQRFQKRLKEGQLSRIRFLQKPSKTMYRLASQLDVIIDFSPVVYDGSIELPHYLQEITVSHTTHRYGNCFEELN